MRCCLLLAISRPLFVGRCLVSVVCMCCYVLFVVCCFGGVFAVGVVCCLCVGFGGVCCLLLGDCLALFVVRCLSSVVARGLLCVVWCLVLLGLRCWWYVVGCCSLVVCVVRCLSFGVRCRMSPAVCCLVVVVCCLLV